MHLNHSYLGPLCFSNMSIISVAVNLIVTLEEDYILTWGVGAKTSLGVCLTKLKH